MCSCLTRALTAHLWPLARPVCTTVFTPPSSVDDLSLTIYRSFFTFPGASKSKRKEYAGRKLIGYSMEEMYNVVSDVENYKSFVPFCNKSDVKHRSENFLRGDLEIGFPPIVESYTSQVTLIRPVLVRADCTEGKLFNHLTTTWKFNPGLKNNKRSCTVDFYVSFEFKSLLHSQLAHMFFNELIRQMESAFFAEAERRYGRATVQAMKLKVLRTR